LERLGRVRVMRSGEIGPLIEVLMGRRVDSVALAWVAVLAPPAAPVEAAFAKGEISGKGFETRCGVFTRIRSSRRLANGQSNGAPKKGQVDVVNSDDVNDLKVKRI
jgi:hypothetical protein